MVRVMCPECRIELDRGDWICPQCGSPAEEEAHSTGKEISTKGMVVLLVTFVGVPVLLFLLHLLVPGL